MLTPEQVADWLAKTGRTQRELAEAADMHFTRLNDWLNGRRDILLETARRLAGAMAWLENCPTASKTRIPAAKKK